MCYKLVNLLLRVKYICFDIDCFINYSCLAKEQLGWQPIVPVREGLRKTIEYFARELRGEFIACYLHYFDLICVVCCIEDGGEIIPTGPDAAKPQQKIKY